jgi:hypothetical protein
MKTAEKLSAGWLLILGFMFLAISVSEVLNQSSLRKVNVYPVEGEQVFSAPENNDAIIGGIVFGLPTITLGGWLTLSLYLQSRREKKTLKQQADDDLQSLFYQMLQENNGKITLLRFAMQSQLPAGTARKYLDEKAKEFNANFKVNEEGAVSYHFDV